MSTYSDWIPDITYSFKSVAPGILQDEYQELKLESIGNYRRAKEASKSELLSQWRAVAPHIPGAPVSPEMARWLVFTSAGNETVVLANEWIEGDSVRSVSFENYIIDVTGSNPQERERIVAALLAMRVKFGIRTE